MRFTRIDRQQLPGVFLIVITMSALALFVQIDRMKNKSADLRAKAYKQTPTGVRIEAEEMNLSGASVDPTGTFIQFASPPATSSQSCPPAGEQVAGSAIIDVDLNIAANYRMWIQTSGKGDSANSVWLQLDNLYCVKAGDLAGMPEGTWEWVNYQGGDTGSRIPTPIVGTGHHLVKLFGNGSEPGVGVDRIVMLMDDSCTPSGNGDECIGVVSTPTPTPVPPTSTPTPTIVTSSKNNPVDSPKITTTTLPKAKLNQPYWASVVATDNTISDILGMTATNLPAGLSLSPCTQTTDLGGSTVTCPVVGTPAVKGISFPVFTVTDQAGNRSSRKMKLQVE